MPTSVDTLANQPVVIDNGSGMLKAGFAGSNAPKVVFRSLVGRTKLTRIMPGGAMVASYGSVGLIIYECRRALTSSWVLRPRNIVEL